MAYLRFFAVFLVIFSLYYVADGADAGESIKDNIDKTMESVQAAFNKIIENLQNDLKPENLQEVLNKVKDNVVNTINSVSQSATAPKKE